MSDNVIHAVSGGTAGMAAMVCFRVASEGGINQLDGDISFGYVEHAGSSRCQGGEPEYLCGIVQDSSYGGDCWPLRGSQICPLRNWHHKWYIPLTRGY